MKLEIITPDRTLYSGEVTSVKFPGSGGKFETLNNHAPVISSLEAGVITIKVDGRKEEIEVSGGIVEVLNNKIIVLA